MKILAGRSETNNNSGVNSVSMVEVASNTFGVSEGRDAVIPDIIYRSATVPGGTTPRMKINLLPNPSPAAGEGSGVGVFTGESKCLPN